MGGVNWGKRPSASGTSWKKGEDQTRGVREKIKQKDERYPGCNYARKGLTLKKKAVRTINEGHRKASQKKKKSNSVYIQPTSGRSGENEPLASKTKKIQTRREKKRFITVQIGPPGNGWRRPKRIRVIAGL